MGRKKKDVPQLPMTVEEASKLEQEHEHELETNPKYSLEVDPEKKYNLSIEQKNFIQYYVEFKNVNVAAELSGIDMDTAKAYFVSYASQMEIRRINMALYQRQFHSKLLDINQIGGYLSSLLTDTNVPIADRLKSSEKLKVAQMIIDLNMLKINSMQNPAIIMNNDINLQLKDLSVDAIKELLKQSEKRKEPNTYSTVCEELTPEEEAYLSTLPTEDLLQILNDSKKKKGDKK